MKPKFFIITSLLTLSLCSSFAQTGVNYKRSSNYGNLKLSMNDFKRIVASIIYYNNESLRDTSYHSKYYTFSCDLSNNSGKAISINTFDQLSKLRLDENYTELDLIYNSSYAGLSNVEINLHSYSRQISVGGIDENKVEALYQDINSQLESDESFFSGIDWGLIVFGLLLISAVISSFVLFGLVIKLSEKKGTQLTFIQSILLFLYLILLACCMFSSISLRDIFPRFLITPDSTSWIDRNANLMGFCGFFIGLISLVYNCFNWISKKLKIQTNDK